MHDDHPRQSEAAAAHAAAGLHRRSLLGAALSGSAALAVGLRAPAVRGQAKKFAGVTLNGSVFSHTYWTALKDYVPEFEQASGMKINMEVQAFPVYNQRMDLELSTKGSAYDFCTITFIYSGRWVDSGWMFPLQPFLDDPNITPAGWNAADFVEGTQTHLRTAKGVTSGFAFDAGTMIMCMARGDLVESAGLVYPRTFDELVTVCESVNRKEGTSAFVADRLHHWNWIPYLMGFGGGIFVDPPGNLMPTLDTPEAAKAGEYYADLLNRFAPSGVLSFTDDQALRAQMAGRSNIRTQGLSWFTPLAKDPESKVQKTVRFAHLPVGPKGSFPGSNSTGVGIPAGARQPEAAWEFIKWAVSKEMFDRLVVEKGFSGVPRQSVIEGDAFQTAMTFNGQDVSKLHLQVLQLGGKGGYMKYRTVPVFPQVGDKINKAIDRIVSGQQNGAAAMSQAQDEAIVDLKKSGVL